MPIPLISLHYLISVKTLISHHLDRLNVDMHRLKNTQFDTIRPLFDRYQLKLQKVEADNDIPYSFWGAPEAGRNKSLLYARQDTPIHSLLHEACHYICMPPNLRDKDEVDAGGTAQEENACCYLQLLLSDHIPGFNQNIHFHDMDTWGYNFRLGSSKRWFYADSGDAQAWLIKHSIINECNQPTWQLRKQL